MTDKGTYTLNCEVCGEPFNNKEAFPHSQLCPVCSGNKELVEKCLLTPLELSKLEGNEWIDGRWYYNPYNIMRATLVKAIPIIRKAVEDEVYMRGWRKGNELKQKRLDIKLELAKKAVAEEIKRELEARLEDVTKWRTFWERY